MILTLEECKTYLNLTDTEYDAQIDVFIPAVESYIQQYCNHDFIVDGVETYPTTLKMTAAKMVWLNILNIRNVQSLGVSSESIGNHSVSYCSEDYPADIVKVLKMYRKVRII